MESVFAETSYMVEHTMTVLGHALEIHEQEGGERETVKAAAILHDIGIPKAREVHGSSSGQYQEIEGPPIAREILTRHGFSPTQIDHVCGIVANHHSDTDPDIVSTIEFKILWDADWLVNIPVDFAEADRDELEAIVERVFKTSTGRHMVEAILLKD